MDNNIFRKRSLERLSAPSDTSERIRAVRPYLKILILALIVMLSALVFLTLTGVAHI